MRKIILFFAGVLLLASCSNESAFQEEIVTASVVADKIGICHNGGNEIVISENALQTHIDHGDAVDRDGDGFYDKESPCSSEIDCDDTTYSLDNSCAPANIGDLRAGGIVFWVDPLDNTKGKVCYTADAPNKLDVFDAITYCNGLDVTVNGIVYNDWYLPTQDELNLMWMNLDRFGCLNIARDSSPCPTAIGGFADGYYWASQVDNNYYTQNFFDGYQSLSRSSSYEFVRAVRAF